MDYKKSYEETIEQNYILHEALQKRDYKDQRLVDLVEHGVFIDELITALKIAKKNNSLTPDRIAKQEQFIQKYVSLHNSAGLAYLSEEMALAKVTKYVRDISLSNARLLELSAEVKKLTATLEFAQ